jgi:diacylglycerol kinase family enzyme
MMRNNIEQIALIGEGEIKSLIPQISTEPRIALLLNGNARRVTPRLVKKLSAYIPSEDIYYSCTLEEATQHCRQIYFKRYDLVFTGGGDGTLQHLLTEIEKLRVSAPRSYPMPILGVLHLGTGNAVASTLGAHTQVIPDLILARQSKSLGLRSQRWVMVNGKRAPFAGIGYDSLILNNYKKFQNLTRDTMFSMLGTGLCAYLLSIVMLSVPEAIFKRRPPVEIINEGRAYLLDSNGKHTREFAEGEVLFAGKANFVGVGTVPCFGYNFKVYPFATTGEHMQLRVGTSSVWEALSNLPAVWRGTYRSPSLQDFYVDKIRIRYPEPQPLQIGGDAVGLQQEVVCQLTPDRTYLADFTSMRQRPALQPARAI